MKNILVLGAGRSSSSLIKYLLEEAQNQDWIVTVGDTNLEMAADKVNGYAKGKAIHFDIENIAEKTKAISDAHLVISLLPPKFHPLVADTCISEGIDMLSASYVSPEIEAMHGQAVNKNVLILKECGLDPGIDHMSAMKVIDEIKEKGGKLQAFYSYTGGLLSPESDRNNPWKYKFTWNPRNVVLAGRGIAKYIENGHYKFIPYHKLFQRTQTIEVDGYGSFEGYANRNSLNYRSIYGLEDIPTLLRGTLRREGYCKAWDVFVQLGMTEDTYPLINLSEMNWNEYTRTFLPEYGTSTEEALCEYLGLDPQGEIFKKLEWLGLFSDEKIGANDGGTPADVLLSLLEKKWSLDKDDKDMIVMQHQFEYTQNGEQKRRTSSMVIIGDDSTYTAMAKTVGLPLGIAAKLVLQGKIKLKGVQVPTQKEIYQPILEELEKVGIEFKEMSD
jgi:saccharopine dehydrogenase-like NADP-dependent oxidoreductase